MNRTVTWEVEETITKIRAGMGESLKSRQDYILILTEAVKRLDEAIRENDSPFLWIEMYHALIYLSATTTMLLETFADTSIPVSER